MKKIFCVIISLILIISSSGCIEKKVKRQKTRENLIYNMGAMPENLSFCGDYNKRQEDLAIALFEGLVRCDERGKIIPGIAENWVVSKDEITYTFKIRDEAKWSNGKAITAEDCVDFFLAALSSTQEDSKIECLYCIFGAKEFRQGKREAKRVAINALDNKTLQIRLNNPNVNFLNFLSKPEFSIKNYKNNLKEWRTSYKSIDYSGPYKVDNISKEEEITLVGNENYWGKEKVKSKRIVLATIENNEKAMAAFDNKYIDVVIDPPLSERKRLLQNDSISVSPIPSGCFMVFNVKDNKDIENINFRRALNSSLNREKIVEDVLGSNGRIAAVFLPSETESNKEKALLDVNYDKDKAKKYMAESKIKDKNKINMIYLNTLENKKVCQTIANQYKADLAITLNINGYNENEFKEMIKKGEYDICIINYEQEYNDPFDFLCKWESRNKENLYGFSNAQYDSLIQNIRTEKDTAKRRNYIQGAKKVLSNEMPVVPIFFNNVFICKGPSVDGITVMQDGSIKIDTLYKK